MRTVAATRYVAPLRRPGADEAAAGLNDDLSATLDPLLAELVGAP